MIFCVIHDLIKKPSFIIFINLWKMSVCVKVLVVRIQRYVLTSKWDNCHVYMYNIDARRSVLTFIYTALASQHDHKYGYSYRALFDCIVACASQLASQLAIAIQKVASLNFFFQAYGDDRNGIVTLLCSKVSEPGILMQKAAFCKLYRHKAVPHHAAR